MQKNMGSLDRKIRLVVALAFVVLILFKFVTGWAAAVLGVVAGVFLLTSLISFCPLYSLLGFTTRKKDA